MILLPLPFGCWDHGQVQTSISSINNPDLILECSISPWLLLKGCFQGVLVTHLAMWFAVVRQTSHQLVKVLALGIYTAFQTSLHHLPASLRRQRL